MDNEFADTNILLYALDERDPVKRRKAAELLDRLARRKNGRISSQVAVEYAANLTKKFGLSAADVQGYVTALESFVLVSVDLKVVNRALEIMGTTSISFWDAAIVAAAEAGGCGVLYSEDLNPGQTIAGVRIVNPFL